MSAKSDLIQRLEHLGEAVNEPAIIDIGISPSSHNAVANLLRKGLGIVAFNIIEDFIKQRSSEALTFLSSSGISFTKLTTALQNSSTLGALRAINFQASLLKKDRTFDLKNFLQTEAYNIWSTSIHPFSLSKFSFVYSNSNVSADEIPELLNAFGIDNCWPRLKMVSDSIGGGIPDLAIAFKNASSRRHGAAHDVNFNYMHSWLTSNISEILAIAAAIDIVLAAKCRQVARNPANNLDYEDINNELHFRFLEMVSTTVYNEKKRLGGKTIKRWNSLTAALAGIRPKLIRNKEFLIIQTTSGRIINWET